MKKMMKSLALFGLAALASISLVSCASTLTTEEIFEKFDSDNCTVVMEMDFGELMSTTVTVETDGDKAKTATETVAMGMESGEVVMYAENDGDTQHLYSQGEDGEWTVTDVDLDEDEEDDVESMKDLFDPDLYEAYDKDGKCYKMKDDEEVELEGMVITDAVIEIGEDTYTLKADAEIEGMEGTLEMTVSKIGSTKVELPDVD